MYKEINDVLFSKNNLYNIISMDSGNFDMEYCSTVPNPYLYDITFSDYKWKLEEYSLDDGDYLYILTEYEPYKHLPIPEGQNYTDNFKLKLEGKEYTYLLSESGKTWLIVKNENEID